MFRLSGTVVAVQDRSGVSDSTGKPWSFTMAKVLTSDFLTTDAILGREMGRPAEGEIVDWYVSVKPAGHRLNVTAVRSAVEAPKASAKAS